jgi:hypothetical protein
MPMLKKKRRVVHGVFIFLEAGFFGSFVYGGVAAEVLQVF